jgi:hypothetical protein
MNENEPGFYGTIGSAQEDITPPVGIYARNWGAATHDMAEEIHRPLTVHALTLQAYPAQAPLVLVSLDLGWWRSAADEWYLRGYVLDTLNLPEENLMLALTHTHAGPSLAAEDADKPGGEFIAIYREKVRKAVVAAIQKAQQAAQTATLEVSTGRCILAQNRDLPDPNGGENSRFLTGFVPGAAADDTLLVGRIGGGNFSVKALLVNYACHPTTLGHANRYISPDYIGAMRETIAKDLGYDFPCLFLQGASGELAPREQYFFHPNLADRHGRCVGHAVLSTLHAMLPTRTQMVYDGVVESGAPLARYSYEISVPPMTLEARRVLVELPLKEDWPTAAEIEAELAVCTDRALAERLQRRLRVRRSLGDGKTAAIPIWLWRAGEVLFVAHPNEAYSQLQTELRAAFPKYAVFVMNVVNGWYGYLPPADTYETDRYSVWQTPFAAGGLEKLIAVCRDELARLCDLRQ